MKRDTLPWLLVVGLLGWLMFLRGCDGAAVAEARARAELAEDSIAVLEPIVEELLETALERDTVLVAVTDTVVVELERIRLETVVLLDTLEAHVDSIGAELLEELELAHAEEVAQLEQLSTERLLWGESWRDAALALEEEVVQLRIRGDQWEAAFRAQSWSKNGWKLAAVAEGLALVAYQVWGPR